MYNTVSDLYNDLLTTCFNEYIKLSAAKRSKMDSKYDSANITLDEYDYSEKMI